MAGASFPLGWVLEALAGREGDGHGHGNWEGAPVKQHEPYGLPSCKTPN